MGDWTVSDYVARHLLRSRLITLAAEWDRKADACENAAITAHSSVARQRMLGRADACRDHAQQLRNTLRA